jgi:hypothetical protein
MDSPCPVLPVHPRIPLTVLAFLFWSVVLNVSAQQAKPNLTGTWKLNLSKSKLATQHGTGGDLYRIKQSEPRLEMVHMFSDRSETYSYVIDGKWRVANRSTQDGVTRAKAYWDGATLLIEKQQETGRGQVIFVVRYTLSQDGKSLAVTHHVNGSPFSAAFDESLTYEKLE